MSDQHQSPIKTPKQVIIVVVASLAILIAIPALFSQLVTLGLKLPDAADSEVLAKLIQPVARVEIAAGGAAAQGPRSGEQIYTAICGACHGAGVAGAPKTGDNAVWAPRIALGLEALTKSATTGKGAMPPKGGGADLSEVELASAIVFMANKSGASFKEPAAPVAAAPADAAAAAAPPPAETAAAAPADPAPAAPATAAAADGKGIYDKTCVACHAAGVAGAPKLGDKAAWAPRLASGDDALLKSVISGKGAMPPKGGNTGLSDAEVKAAVAYMLAQAK